MAYIESSHRAQVRRTVDRSLFAAIARLSVSWQR
jgi:hypothetical protein